MLNSFNFICQDALSIIIMIIQHNVEYYVSYPGVDSERQGSENRRGGGFVHHHDFLQYLG